ncbi:MAG: diacylglycerol kinase [Deltaproteobacteria bacterium]|nr:diacylglycerol kinase [Deltaproteobacteria bacterium]
MKAKKAELVKDERARAEPPKKILPKKLEPTEELSDADVFLAAMQGSQRVNRDGRGRAGAPPPPTAEQLPIVDEDAEVLAELASLVEGTGHFDISDTDEYVEGAVEGLDRRILRSLKRGDYSVAAHVDLHGLTRDPARAAVEQFLLDSRRRGYRCVLVVHGRGHNSKDNIPVLKGLLKTWFERTRIGNHVRDRPTPRRRRWRDLRVVEEVMAAEPNPGLLPVPKQRLEDKTIPSEIRALQKKRSAVIASFGFAIAGLLRTLCSQRNMKIHWVSGLAVMLVGMALDLDIAARAGLMFCVFLVIALETLNTAFEAFVDLHIREFAHAAMVAKDAAAGAVFVIAMGAVAILSDVLLHRWEIVEASAVAIMRTIVVGLPLLTMVGVVLGSNLRPVLRNLIGLAALGATGYLAAWSTDVVFSLGAFAFVLVALFARHKEGTLVA